MAGDVEEGCPAGSAVRDAEHEADAGDVMRALTDENLPPAMAAALLVALRAKGETAAEVRGFATAMRGLARRFDLPPGLPAADIVGTGGDGSGSLNLSTGAALLALDGDVASVVMNQSACGGSRIVDHRPDGAEEHGRDSRRKCDADC